MSNNPHRCVIDASGNYVTFVLLAEQADGPAVPYAYKLQPGESLIEASAPCNILKPCWTGFTWKETATPEEIEAAKPELPPPAPPSELELFAVEISTAMALMQQQNDMTIAELTMMLAMTMQQEVNSDV